MLAACFIHPALYIAESPDKGRGVFTIEALEAGKIIEISPVVVFNAEERMHLEKTDLYNYIFEWGENHSGCCVALGYVSLYNHQSPATCEYIMDFENALMQIVTTQEVAAGQELTINYTADWNEEKPVWFKTSSPTPSPTAL